MRRRDLLKVVGAASVGALALDAFSSGRGMGHAAAGLAGTNATECNLQKLLAASGEKNKCVGASAAVYEQGRWDSAVYGLANLATGVEVTENTIFHIGSITKIFNTTLLMTLVDEGKVDLTRPVLHYLPEMRTADMDALRQMTVAMLVNHTSGIDGEMLPDHGPDQERIADAIPRMAAMEQVHAPGKDMSYCNTATLLAGYLTQKVLDKSWYELIEERIFAPLEMDHAIVDPQDALLYRNSVGHYFHPETEKPFRTNQTYLPLSFAPAGTTAMMSAKNLVQFGMMHANDGVGLNGARVLSEGSARQMRKQTASYQGPMGEFNCGLGWLMDGTGMVNHGGGGPGIISWLYVHPETNSSIAVLTNTVTGMAVATEVSAPFVTARGSEPLGAIEARLAAAAKDEPVDGSAFIGRYGNMVMTIDVKQEQDRLFAYTTQSFAYYSDLPTDPTQELLKPVGDGVFSGDMGVIKFINPDASGETQHLATGGRLYKRSTHSPIGLSRWKRFQSD